MAETWFVVWTLVSSICGGCNPSGPDEYGRYQQYQTLGGCCHERREEHFKEFKTKDEAQKFIDNGPLSCGDRKVVDADGNVILTLIIPGECVEYHLLKEQPVDVKP